MDSRLKYCQACLSTDRDLFPLKKLEGLLQNLELWQLLSAQGGVCFECKQMIRKLSEFRQQVHKVQKLFYHNKFQNLPPLTKLSVKTLSDCEYSFSYDPLANIETCYLETTYQERNDTETNIDIDQEVKIKEEEIDIKLSPDNSTYSDEESDTDAIDIKPTTSDIYVEMLDKPREKVKKKIDILQEDKEKEKFTTVVFTEEEMLKNREEKRNHPNFKKIPYKCDSCVLGFIRKDNYDVHLKKKHNKSIGVHSCAVCLCRFPNLKLVSRHQSKHYVCYRCRLCKYETLEQWSIYSHCRAKHAGDQVEKIHCSYCVFVAKSPAALAEHTAAQHAVYCHECGAKFKTLSTLKSHIRRIHKVKREFICNICSKPYKTKSRLETHLATHNDTIAQKLAYCAICNIQYKNIYVYRNHLKTSANHAEQTYECVECNKRFASKVYWKKHYNFYHLHKSQFHCDICNKLFISDWRLKSHRQTQHGVSRSRDHHCNVCGKQFFTLSTLKGHQLTHSAQRSFMCEDCGDTFKQRPALYTHYKLVHRGAKRVKKLQTT